MGFASLRKLKRNFKKIRLAWNLFSEEWLTVKRFNNGLPLYNYTGYVSRIFLERCEILGVNFRVGFWYRSGQRGTRWDIINISLPEPTTQKKISKSKKKINIYNKKILFRDFKISCFVNKHFSTILNLKVISKKKLFSKNRWRNRKNFKNHWQNLIHNFLEPLLIPLSFLAKVLFGTKFRNKLKNQFRIFAMLWLNNFWT